MSKKTSLLRDSRVPVGNIPYIINFNTTSYSTHGNESNLVAPTQMLLLVSNYKLGFSNTHHTMKFQALIYMNYFIQKSSYYNMYSGTPMSLRETFVSQSQLLHKHGTWTTPMPESFILSVITPPSQITDVLPYVNCIHFTVIINCKI